MYKKIFIHHSPQKIGRYKFLLISMFVFIGLRPFLENFVRLTLLTDIFFILVLIAGVYTLNQSSTAFRVSWLLASMVFLVKIAIHFLGRLDSLYTLELLLSVVFISQIIFVIVKQLLVDQEVTGDLVMGGACAFILLGILWSFIYCLVEIYYPNSFNSSAESINIHTNFLYFSLTTLTTVGYGDVLAVSHQARGLANLEAIVGQLYLAIMVSRLVGLHASKAPRKVDKE